MLALGTKVTVAAGRSRVIDVSPGGGVSLSAFSVTAGADAEWEVYIDRALNDLARPGQPTLALNTALGQIPASTKVYVTVTTIDAAGLEGPPSSGGKVATTGAGTSTNRVTASWGAVTGATAYRVYAASRPGMEALVAETTAISLSIDSLPAEDVRGVPTKADMMLATLKNQGSSPAIGASVSISSRLIIFVTLQTAADAFIACLAA